MITTNEIDMSRAGSSARPPLQTADTMSVGMAVEDITPPLDVGLLMSTVEGRWAPFKAVRTPLKARALVIGCGTEQVALVSLDLLAIDEVIVNGWERFKGVLAAAVPQGIAPERIIVACTHTHSAPESSRTTELYRAHNFRSWMAQTEQKIARAITRAASDLHPCEVRFGSTELQGFSLQRRVPIDGRIVMSDALQPISAPLFERGPVDRRVSGIWFAATGGPTLATLVHASCHPVHEMCLPQVSADFPGELCTAMEQSPGNGLPLFFNGAAGDINPPTVSEGPEAARNHGYAMAAALATVWPHAQALETKHLYFCHQTVPIPMRSLRGTRSHQTVLARIAAVSFGSVALVFLPGEVFTEIGQAIEKESPFAHTLIIGYAESSIGYVPTDQAFEEGGYEIGPGKWSFLQPGAASLILDAGTGLLRQLQVAQSDPGKSSGASRLASSKHRPG